MHIRPTLEEVLAYDGPASLAAIALELHADGDTPLTLLRRLGGDRPGAFLLESIEGGEQLARYSFIGVGTEQSLSIAANTATLREAGQVREFACVDPLAPLQQWLADRPAWTRPDLPNLQGGAVGYLALANYLQKHTEQKGMFLETAHPVKFPDAVERNTKEEQIIPASLEPMMQQPKQSIFMAPGYQNLKEYLWNKV
mgnify:CR=1 FL=1